MTRQDYDGYPSERPAPKACKTGRGGARYATEGMFFVLGGGRGPNFRASIRHNGRPMIPHEFFTHAHVLECCLSLPIELGTVDDDARLDPKSGR